MPAHTIHVSQANPVVYMVDPNKDYAHLHMWIGMQLSINIPLGPHGSPTIERWEEIKPYIPSHLMDEVVKHLSTHNLQTTGTIGGHSHSCSVS